MPIEAKVALIMFFVGPGVFLIGIALAAWVERIERD